jgi:hypothetical protein
MNRQPTFRAIATILLSIVSLSRMAATTLFVSQTGNDQDDGSSIHPWRTIWHGIAMVGPGDTLLVRGGIYSEHLSTVRDGNATAGAITILALPGDPAIVDGANDDGADGLWLMHSYITISGLSFRNWRGEGILIQGAGNITVANGEISHCGYGVTILQRVHDFVLENLDIHDYNPADGYGIDATSYTGEPIADGLISHCKAYMSTPPTDQDNVDGIALGHMNGRETAWNSFNSIRNIHLVGCEVYNVGDGFDISGVDNLLDGCIAHHTWFGGNYKLWGNSVTLVNCIGYASNGNLALDKYPTVADTNLPPATPPPHVALYNCIFYGGVNNIIEMETDSSYLKMYNCIIGGPADPGMPCIFEDSGFRREQYEGDNNIFLWTGGDTVSIFRDPNQDIYAPQFTDGTWQTLTGQDRNSRVVSDATILFIDTSMATLDLHYNPSSPAINGGREFPGTTPARDFDGRPRDDGRIDIGAFEYIVLSRPIDRNAEPSLFESYPNPFHGSTALRFSISSPCHVSLVICDITGRTVRSLLDRQMEAGLHTIQFDAVGLPPGSYFCTLRASDHVVGGLLIAL